MKMHVQFRTAKLMNATITYLEMLRCVFWPGHLQRSRTFMIWSMLRLVASSIFIEGR